MKIGLIGCGRWGRNILRDLVAQACKVSVVDIDESTRQAALAGGGQAFYRTIGDLPPMDGLVVAVTTSNHADVLMELASRAEPVFCEKPLANDVLAARQVVAMLGGRLFMMDKWRYHAGIQALASIARNVELGSVLGLNTRRIGWGIPHKDVDSSWILLPHEIAIAHEILGQYLTPQSARAVCNQDNIPMFMTVQFGDTPWHMAEIGIAAPQPDRGVTLYCRHGTATLAAPMDDHITLVRLPDDVVVPPGAEKFTETRTIAVSMPLLEELKEFLGFLRGGKKPRSSGADGLRIVDIIAAIRTMAGLSA